MNPFRINEFLNLCLHHVFYIKFNEGTLENAKEINNINQ